MKFYGICVVDFQFYFGKRIFLITTRCLLSLAESPLHINSTIQKIELVNLELILLSIALLINVRLGVSSEIYINIIGVKYTNMF